MKSGGFFKIPFSFVRGVKQDITGATVSAVLCCACGGKSCSEVTALLYCRTGALRGSHQ